MIAPRSFELISNNTEIYYNAKHVKFETLKFHNTTFNIKDHISLSPDGYILLEPKDYNRVLFLNIYIVTGGLSHPYPTYFRILGDDKLYFEHSHQQSGIAGVSRTMSTILIPIGTQKFSIVLGGNAQTYSHIVHIWGTLSA